MAKHSIKVNDAYDLLEKNEAVLIDVREPAEYQAMHIAFAKNIPKDSMTVDQLANENTKIIIQCRSGRRSSDVIDALLQENDALELFNLEGGILAWKDANLAVKEDQSIKVLPLERQMQLSVGILIFVFSLLAMTVNVYFLVFCLLISLGLMNAGFTGWCGLVKLLQYMPWNKA